MYRRKSYLFLLAVSALTCGCGSNGGRLDQRSRAILAGATKVEVFRIDGDPEQGPLNRDDAQIAGFKVLSQGKDQGKELAAKLYKLLKDDQSYTDVFANCYSPGVVFRVWKGSECVDVMICYRCKNFYVGPPSDQRVRENASFYESRRTADFIDLAKTAFPDDKDIQQLQPTP